MPALESAQRTEIAEARLAVYRFLLAALDKPTPQQHVWFGTAEFEEMLRKLAEEFEVPLKNEEPAADSPSSHEARYLACFEVGLPAPPVPLLASAYNHHEPVTAVIREHALFYRRFGLRLAPDNIEPADHLLNELAFLSRLDELLSAGSIDADSLLRARRDFLRRHVTRWLPEAARKARHEQLPGVYQALLATLATAATQDLELTSATVDSRKEDQP